MAMPLKNRTFFADSLIVLVCGRMKIMSRYIRVELIVLILDGKIRKCCASIKNDCSSEKQNKSIHTLVIIKCIEKIN